MLVSFTLINKSDFLELGIAVSMGLKGLSRKVKFCPNVLLGHMDVVEGGRLLGLCVY